MGKGFGRARAAAGLLVGALAVSAGLVATAAPAAAWDGLCDSGYACGYEDNSYASTGEMYGTSYSERRWLGFYNIASSVSANGAGCDYTRYYKSWNLTTGHVYGDYFTMYSRQRLGTNYRDPQLSNGAGYDGAGENWDNTIEATLFTGC